MISKSEFLNRVHGSVFPLLKKVDQERIVVVRKCIIRLIILFTILGGGSYFFLQEQIKEDPRCILFPIVIFFIFLLVVTGKLYDFSHQLKQKFEPYLLEFLKLKQDEKEAKLLYFFDFNKWTEKTETTSQIFKKFFEWAKKGFFPFDLSRISFDDCLSADDGSFSMIESECYCSHGRNQTKFFKGLILELNNDIKIRGKILIFQKVNFMSSKKFKPKKSLGYQEVTTDDSVFDNRFNVYTDIGANVKEVLNKVLLRQILSLRDIYPKAVINLLIENGKITIAIDTGKNMFEFFKMHRSLLKDKFFEQFYDEVAMLYKVRDTFNS